MRNLRILICCPNGAGTSLMLEAMVKKATGALGLPTEELYHCSIREGVKIASRFHLILCPKELAPQLEPWKGQAQIIGLENPFSPRELEERLKAFYSQWNAAQP